MRPMIVLRGKEHRIKSKEVTKGWLLSFKRMLESMKSLACTGSNMSTNSNSSSQPKSQATPSPSQATPSQATSSHALSQPESSQPESSHPAKRIHYTPQLKLQLIRNRKSNICVTKEWLLSFKRMLGLMKQLACSGSNLHHV